MKNLKTLMTAALLGVATMVSAQESQDSIQYGGWDKYRIGGYGEMVAAFKDYGTNRFYGHKEGNAKENRSTISIPRFVIAGDYKFNKKWRSRQTLWGSCTDANPKLLLNDT